MPQLSDLTQLYLKICSAEYAVKASLHVPMCVERNSEAPKCALIINIDRYLLWLGDKTVEAVREGQERGCSSNEGR